MKPGSILTPERLDAEAPIGPQLLQVLRQRIVRAELPPGTRLSEQDIATAYAMSRQPVREAFIRLAEDGLLEVRPQRGSFVRKISEDGVMTARFVREAIEADLVRLAAERATGDDVTGLRRLVERQAAVPDGDAPTFMRLDEQFHRTLAEMAGMTGAWGVLEQIKSQMDRVRFLTTVEFPKALLITQHGAIVEAVASRDPDRAEDAMRTHLRKILNDLPAIVAAHPSFFETGRTSGRPS